MPKCKFIYLHIIHADKNTTKNNPDQLLTIKSKSYSIHDMNSREIIKLLRKDGWRLHHTKGDHQQFKHPQKSGKVTITHPKKDIPVGTLRNIYRQAGWHWR